MELSPAEEIAYSTVRIKCELSNNLIGTGTGFIYALGVKGNKSVPVIITNKHVVAGANKGEFLLTYKDATGGPTVGEYLKCKFGSFQTQWVPHPDQSVDLCAMPIGSILNEARNNNIEIFFKHFDKTLLPSAEDIEDMIGLENITMVGYPNGLWDSKNNLPIFRRGVLATNYKYDWNGKKEFMIDAACFPGSSGSPVILFDIGSYQTRKGGFIGTDRIKLLGILYGGPQYSVQGEVKIVTVPTQQKAVSIAGIPNNLGNVIKAEQLLAFEEIFSKK